jgi:hypothetical protein
VASFFRKAFVFTYMANDEDGADLAGASGASLEGALKKAASALSEAAAALRHDAERLLGRTPEAPDSRHDS